VTPLANDLHGTHPELRVIAFVRHDVVNDLPWRYFSTATVFAHPAQWLELQLDGAAFAPTARLIPSIDGLAICGLGGIEWLHAVIIKSEY
jgi:hypothetical protein